MAYTNSDTSSSSLDDLLIVGAPNDDDFAGSVYLFQKELNGSYSFLEKVVDENPQDEVSFNTS